MPTKKKSDTGKGKTKKKGGKTHSFGGKVMFTLNVIAILGLLLTYLSMWINPQTMPYLAFVGYAYPILLAINLFFVVLWAFTMRLRFLYSLVAILIGYNVFFSHFEFFNSNNPSHADSISIFDFNTGHNVDKKIADRAAHIASDNDSIIQLIKHNNYDIVCLQEVKLPRKTIANIVNKRKLNLSTSSFIPHQINKGSSFVTISRFPIINTRELIHDNVSFANINDIIIDADTLRVYNIHLSSNKLSDEDISNVNTLSGYGKKTIGIFKNINRKITHGAKDRAKQAEMLRTDIKACKHKIIICGDMNDTPCTYTYRIISNGLKDAFYEKGSCWGNTYNGNLPNIRIDYILVDQSFTINSYQLHENIKISDHFPISATINM